MTRPLLLDLFCGAGGAAMGSDTERAWAAGFFDGEGWVGPRFDHRPGRNPTLQLGIEQTDRRPLERFMAAVGATGTVGQRGAPRAPNRRLLYRIHMGHQDTVRTMAALWPWLCEPKRDQYRESLRRLLAGYMEEAS